MNLGQLKAEALKLSVKQRLDLIQSLVASLYPVETKSTIIDSEVELDTSFEVERDPPVTVPSLVEAPRRINIGEVSVEGQTTPSKDEAPPAVTLGSVGESFQMLREALESEFEPKERP